MTYLRKDLGPVDHNQHAALSRQPALDKIGQRRCTIDSAIAQPHRVFLTSCINRDRGPPQPKRARDVVTHFKRAITGERNMIKHLAVKLLVILTLSLGINHGAWAQSAESTSVASGPEGVGTATVVTFHGKIVAKDAGRKLVTLEGPEGRQVTVWVQNPDNLKAAKVGDPFAARFYDIVTVRKKKPGESIQNATTVGVWTTNPLGVPGGSRAQLSTAVVTVDAIDEANGTVTVKAADGSTQTVKARNPQNLKLIKVGDELVVQNYRAVAISLSKESAGGAS